MTNATLDLSILNAARRKSASQPATKNEVVEQQKFTVDQILDMLRGASFERWYENDFMDHITGEEEAPSLDDIKKALTRML